MKDILQVVKQNLHRRNHTGLLPGTEQTANDLQDRFTDRLYTLQIASGTLYGLSRRLGQGIPNTSQGRHHQYQSGGFFHRLAHHPAQSLDG